MENIKINSIWCEGYVGYIYLYVRYTNIDLFTPNLTMYNNKKSINQIAESLISIEATYHDI